MKVITTSNPDFRILVDEYPYTQSRELIQQECQEWYEHPARKNNKIENYLLDSPEFSSLNVSFETKLKDGNFSFLYYKETLLGFIGLQIDGERAQAHRLFTNPHQYTYFLGSMPQYVYPFQISTAITKGCSKYLLTFNGKNERFYYFYRDRDYLRSKYYKPEYINGPLLVSDFDFIGTQTINYCEQLVVSLDLNRPDIQRFCHH